MPRQRGCRQASYGRSRTPRWLEIVEDQRHPRASMGFVSFRIHGWRGLVLRAVRPWDWLNNRLTNHWTKRLPHPSWGGGDDGPRDAGVREPRRPSPLAGSGAVALPEPSAGGS